MDDKLYENLSLHRVLKLNLSVIQALLVQTLRYLKHVLQIWY